MLNFSFTFEICFFFFFYSSRICCLKVLKYKWREHWSNKTVLPYTETTKYTCIVLVIQKEEYENWIEQALLGCVIFPQWAHSAFKIKFIWGSRNLTAGNNFKCYTGEPDKWIDFFSIFKLNGTVLSLIQPSMIEDVRTVY